MDTQDAACGLAFAGQVRSRRSISANAKPQAAIAVWATLCLTATATADTHFRDRVRPLLQKHCLECHNPTRSKGGLDLSRRETLLEGGSNGPGVVPGQPDQSQLWQKIFKKVMPPKNPLDDRQLEVLKKWIQDGAKYDEPLTTAKAEVPLPWSFRAMDRPKPPTSKYDDLSAHPIDRFLFKKLEEKGLEPAAIADRLTLLRSVTFDLTGLPPTPVEVDAFLRDESKDAYERVVDRLLASPAYAERWARHWLDVVRFGESHGYEQNHVRPNAWPYRDYVIYSLHVDKPYDQFVREQLAGDAISPGDPNVEAGTGFLVAGVHDTVGNATEEGRRQQRANDLEDIVSTVGAAFLGLSINCARCHDHKFDPISQRDFYRLTAVFAGVKHGEREFGKKDPTSEDKTRELELLARVVKLRNLIHDLEFEARIRVLKSQGVDPVPRPAINARRNVDAFEPTLAKFVRFTVSATKDAGEPCLDELEIYGEGESDNLARGGKATASSVLPGYPIHQIAHINDGRTGNDWSWISNQKGSGWVQIELPEAVKIAKVIWGRDGTERPTFFDRLASKYHIEVSADGKAWTKVSDQTGRAAVPEEFAADDFFKVLTAEEIERRRLLFEEIANLRKLVYVAKPQPYYLGQFIAPDPIYLLKRGDVLQRGDLMSPGPLNRLDGMPIDFDAKQATSERGRRLALAEWLTHPEHPLTPRVLVNRLWQHHFGRGLVATPSDFGNNGAAPSHPELLDWLARDFVDNGWKMKRLHRLMVTSRAYQQAVRGTEASEAKDADNVYLSRMPLRRMEAEVLRDSVLAVSGKLDRSMGGPSFPLFKYRVVNVAIYEPLDKHGPQTFRRAIYSLSARAIREDLIASFDGVECAQRNPRRESTTTPLQALTLLNGSFAVDQAEYFAERIKREASPLNGMKGKVALGFRLAFGRGPNEEEMHAALQLVSRHGWATFARALLNANEFLYY